MKQGTSFSPFLSKQISFGSRQKEKKSNTCREKNKIKERLRLIGLLLFFDFTLRTMGRRRRQRAMPSWPRQRVRRTVLTLFLSSKEEKICK